MKDDSFVWDDPENSQEVDDSDSLYEIFNNPENEDDSVDEEYIENEKSSPPIFVRRLLMVLIILSLAYGYFNIPYLPVDTITTNNLIFVTREDILNGLGLEEGKSYSKVDIWQARKNLDDVLVSDCQLEYDRKTKSIDVMVSEIKPLALDESGTLYYEEDGEILSSTDISYDVPRLFGFDQESGNDIIMALNTLEYSIIKEISAITLLETQTDEQLVLMQMNDGNYIEIYVSQIPDKMPYYIQIQNDIEERNGGKPGLIHLDIGDYYEPFN